MTGLILAAGVALGAAAFALGRLLAREHHITQHAAGPGDLMAVADAVREPTKLERELAGFEADDVGHARCGCWWVSIDGGVAQLFPCGRHEGMLRAVREEGL